MLTPALREALGGYRIALAALGVLLALFLLRRCW